LIRYIQKDIYDFIGIIIKFDQIEAITTNEGIFRIKRRIEIGDQSGCSKDLMIFEEEISCFPENKNLLLFRCNLQS
jgi:hypothetical protein